MFHFEFNVRKILITFWFCQTFFTYLIRSWYESICNKKHIFCFLFFCSFDKLIFNRFEFTCIFLSNLDCYFFCDLFRYCFCFCFSLIISCKSRFVQFFSRVFMDVTAISEYFYIKPILKSYRIRTRSGRKEAKNIF